MKSVCVIGGTNFVGPHILKNLLAKGMDVSICTRGFRQNPYVGQVKEMIADTNFDREGTKRVLGGRGFDAVIDCVAYSPQEVLNVLESVDTGRYIQISTMGVYDCIENRLTEEMYDPYLFDWKEVLESRTKHYGLRKKAAEAVAYQKFGDICVTTVRPAYVTDPNNTAHELNMRISELIQMVDSGAWINPECLTWRVHFTHIEDEAKLITELTEREYRKPVNVACEKYIFVGDLISYIEKKIG